MFGWFRITVSTFLGFMYELKVRMWSDALNCEVSAGLLRMLQMNVRSACELRMAAAMPLGSRFGMTLV